MNGIGFKDFDWNQVTLEVNVGRGRGTLTNILGYREVDAKSATVATGRA